MEIFRASKKDGVGDQRSPASTSSAEQCLQQALVL